MVLSCGNEAFIAPYKASQVSILEARAETFLLQSKIMDAARSFEMLQGECAVFNTDLAKPMIIGTTEVPTVTQRARKLVFVPIM